MTLKQRPLIPQEPAPLVIPPAVVEDDDVVVPELPLETLVAGTKEKYFESVGRRKRAVARVRLMTRKSGDDAKEDAALMTVNGKDYKDYFRDLLLVNIVESPLRKLKSLQRFKVSVLVNGGGIAGQAGAVRHGISRGLEIFDANFRKKLKKAGYLMRDPRKVERKKPGLKKARKGPRWAKR